MVPPEKEGEDPGATRREVLKGTFGTALALAVGSNVLAVDAKAQGGGTVSALNARQKAILDELMKGNERYVSGKAGDHDLIAARKILAHGQNPSTAIIRCADSRVAPELVFDMALGELFVCGVAGNIPTDEIVASLEYAVSNLGTELIVVMGHSDCGAVGAALSHQNSIDSLPGNLPGLLSQILPSVLAVGKTSDDALSASIKRNAMDGAGRIPKMSTVVDSSIREGKVGIVSGVYDLSSGQFILSTPV